MSQRYERMQQLRMREQELRKISRELPPTILPPGVLGDEVTGLRRILKRLIRKCTTWILQPWYSIISRYQESTKQALDSAAAALAIAAEDMQAVTDWMEDERYYLETCRAELDAQHNCINDMNGRLHRSEEALEDALCVNRWNEEIFSVVKGMELRMQKRDERLDLLEIGTNAARNQLSCLLARSDISDSLWDKHSLSQSGEDAIVAYVADAYGISPGECSYLDLGANHAKALSNTYAFYEQGARGVLVEANPALIEELQLFRGGDVILNRCVAERDGESMSFYIFDDGDGLSTADKESADAYTAANQRLGGYRCVEVEGITVNSILERYFADAAPIFMNVDIEGLEEKILSAVDFERFRPLVICVETVPYTGGIYFGQRDERLRALLAERDYVEYAFTGINSIFVDKRASRRERQQQETRSPVPAEPRPYWDMFRAEFMYFDEGGRYEDELIMLPPGVTMFGPYIPLAPGCYELNMSVHTLSLPRRTLTLRVTAEDGTKLLAEARFDEPALRLRFDCAESVDAVEFVLRNDTQGTLVVSRLSLAKIKKAGEEE